MAYRTSIATFESIRPSAQQYGIQGEAYFCVVVIISVHNFVFGNGNKVNIAA